jgi:hypothetical protein
MVPVLFAWDPCGFDLESPSMGLLICDEHACYNAYKTIRVGPRTTHQTAPTGARGDVSAAWTLMPSKKTSYIQPTCLLPPLLASTRSHVLQPVQTAGPGAL